MDQKTKEEFVQVYDMLMKWKTHYSSVDINSIMTRFAWGPQRNSRNVSGDDRIYDVYYIFAVLSDSKKEIDRQLSELDHAHPLDKAFWNEALDWITVGDVGTNDSVRYHLYHKFTLSSHNNKEMLSEIEQLERYFREQRPDSKLEFHKPIVHSGGCYIATSAYGSYDCPPVWTLRRFRDDVLDKTAAGRAFIKFYYKTSPTLVKIFGKYDWFNAFARSILDRFVKKLNDGGLENTKYNDK